MNSKDGNSEGKLWAYALLSPFNIPETGHPQKPWKCAWTGNNFPRLPWGYETVPIPELGFLWAFDTVLRGE